MAAISVPKGNECYLGEPDSQDYFPISGPVRITNITVPPNPVTFGDADRQGETQVMQQFIQSNNLGGSGRWKGNSRTDATRNWVSEAETRYLDMLTLKPRAFPIDVPALSVGSAFATCEYRAVQYWGFPHSAGGSGVWAMADAEFSGSWFGAPIRTMSGAIIEMVAWNDHLYVSYGTGYDRMTSAGVWSSHTQDAYSFAVWDNKLWTIAPVAGSGWVVYQSTDGAAWTAGASLPTEARPSKLLTFRDVSGSLVLAALAPGGEPNGGLWLYNADVPRWSQTEVQWPRLPADQDCHATVFRDGKLYTNIGNLGMVSVQPGNPYTIVPMGLDQDEGVPADETGRIIGMTSDINDLYIIVDSSTDTSGLTDWEGGDPTGYWWADDSGWEETSGKSTLRSYQGGWHRVYTSTNLTTGNNGVIAVSSAYDRRRVYFTMPDGPYYIDTSAATYNPRFNPHPHFEEGPVPHTTPWWYYGSEGQDKLHGHMWVQCSDMSADETCAVYIAYDLDELNWSLLATITEDGLYELRPGGKVGAKARYFRYKFVLERGADDSVSPQVMYYLADSMRLLPATYGFGINIDLTKSHRGRTPAEMVRRLQELADPETQPELIQFSYREKTTRDLQTHWCRITHMNGTESAGSGPRGEGRWLVSLTAPYKQDRE